MNTPEISIETYPRFEPDQSMIKKGKWFFSYHIVIKNLGDEPCQLLSRRWLITDSNGQKQEVVGDGVIGQQPTISQGGEYSYTSGCLLETPVGTMEGHYVMCTKDGETFNAPIAPFLLAMPGSIN